MTASFDEVVTDRRLSLQLAWAPPASDPVTAAMPDVTISIGDRRASDIRALVERHLEFATSHKPPEDIHALDVAGLLDPAVAVFSCRAGGELLAVGHSGDWPGGTPS